MKLATFFIVFFLTVQVTGQPIQKIKQLLQRKEFTPFNNYIQTPQQSNVSYRWKQLQTIVGDYSAGVINITELVPSQDTTTQGKSNFYRIYLLTGKNKIFFYKFIKTSVEDKDPYQFSGGDELIERVTDSAEYLSFKTLFKQVYGDTLDQDELFLTSIIYGGRCGIGGSRTEYMQQLIFLLQENKIETIRQWLKSPNVQKQLFAITGYRFLVNHGYSLTDDEKRIIAIVRQKKGTIQRCIGCEFIDESIEKVVSEIEATPIKYLEDEVKNFPRGGFHNKRTQTEIVPFTWKLIMIGIIGTMAFLYLIWINRK